MDTKLLSFISLCDTKSFTATAKELNLTQPAVSQHIKALEQEYDVKLLTREGNEIHLTQAGEIMLKYALRIKSLYNDLNRRIEDNKKYAKSLTVGITHTAESNVAPEIFAYYSSENSGSHIKIVSDTIKNLYDKLANYQIDMAIIEGNITNKKFSSVLLGTDSLVAVISPSNPLSEKKVITINDLRKERLVLRNFESGTTSLFINELNRLKLSIDDFKVFLEIDSVSSIKDLVSKNLGVSILPMSACKREVKQKQLLTLPIENMNLSRETSLLFIEGNVDREVLEDITSIYHQEMQNK